MAPTICSSVSVSSPGLKLARTASTIWLSVSSPKFSLYPLGPIAVAVTLLAGVILLAAAFARAAFTAAGWRPPPLSPVVVRPIGLAIAGFAIAVILRAAGVAVAPMAVLPGVASVLFVPAVQYSDGRLRNATALLAPD